MGNASAKYFMINCFLDDKKIVATGTKIGNIHYLNCIENQKAAHAVIICSGNNTKEGIWHRRFCHLGAKITKRAASNWY